MSRTGSARAKGGFVELVKTVVYALLIAAVFRTFLFQPFWIPSGSMKPTLLVGDFLFVNKFAYGYSRHSCPFSLCPFSGRILAAEPERGDVIVFKQPRTGEEYIKRLVGLPGDRIQMIDGRLHINGTAVGLEPAANWTQSYSGRDTEECVNHPVPVGGTCETRRFVETLPNGVRHDVLDFTTRSSDNTPVYVVPAGQYFFMGDNRDNSLDSREWGTVPAENLIGRADRIMFSAAGSSLFAFWTWRRDRFLKAVH